jgi:uncharacterized protein YgbK (DUF1537 family)
MGILFENKADNRRSPVERRVGPSIVVVGSRHPASTAQLINARNVLGMTLIRVDVEAIENDDGQCREKERIVGEAGSLFEKGKPVALTAAFSTLASGREKDVVSVLAGATAALFNSYSVAGMFLSGGDTAMAVCRELGVEVIRVYGEIRPGIPAGEIAIGNRNIRLVTKAGGFGAEMAIIDSMQYLERGVL